jgi:hypothetical protein
MKRFTSGPRDLACFLWPRCLLVLAASVWLVIGAAHAQDRPRTAAKRPARSKPSAPPEIDDLGAQESAKPALGDRGAAGNGGKKDGADLPPLTLRDLIEYAEPSRTALQDVKDYTAVFTKTEVVKGRKIVQEMDMKFRTKPFSVYFHYRNKSEEGRQAIYVDGKYGNNLVVKEVGIKALAGSLSFKPDHPTVMAENRYPVTNVGIGNILEKSLKVWERESRLENVEIDVKFFPNAKLKELPCEVVQLTYPKGRRDFEYSLTRVYFDKESKLPIRAERFGWPQRAGDKPPLVEDYVYTKLKINQKLTDADFDPARYGF